jgi:hypothetical protein
VMNVHSTVKMPGASVLTYIARLHLFRNLWGTLQKIDEAPRRIALMM